MENYRNTTQESKFAVAYSNDKSIIHTSEINPGQQISTGQSNLDIYDTLEQLGAVHGQEVVDMFNQEVMDEGSVE